MAAKNSAYNNGGPTQGILPSVPSWLKNSTKITPSGTVGSGQVLGTSGQKDVLATQGGKPVYNSSPQVIGTANQSGILSQAKPSTPVKSISDGQNTVTYHIPQGGSSQAPTPPAPSSSTPPQQQQPALNSTNSYPPNSTGTTPSGLTYTTDANGNTTYKTANGMTVDASGNSNFQGMVNQLADKSGQPSASYTDLQSQLSASRAVQLALEQSYQDKYKNIDLSGVDTSLATGQEAVLGRTLAAKEAEFANQQAGLSTQLGAANTQQGLQQQGLTSAIGAYQPQLGQYGQTYYQPGQAGQGEQGGNIQLTGQASTDVNNLASAVNNGTISYQSALSQLSGYGTAVANQLLPAIQKINPSFNINQANAQAAAQVSNTQMAGQVSALVDKSNSILDTLPAKFDALGITQKTGSDIATQISNNLSNATGIGVTQTQDYVRTLNEAKATIQSILSSAVNLGVNTGGATADSLLPMNMTKEGLTTAISTIKDIQEKTKKALANLANASGGSQTGGSTGASNVQYNSDGSVKSISF